MESFCHRSSDGLPQFRCNHWRFGIVPVESSGRADKRPPEAGSPRGSRATARGATSASSRNRTRRPAGARHPLGVLLRACRPRQWSKNLLVFAAPGRCGLIDRRRSPPRLAGALLVLACSPARPTWSTTCAIASRTACTRASARPVASGALSVRAAMLDGRGARGRRHGDRDRDRARARRRSAAAIWLFTASYSLWLRRVAVARHRRVAAGFVIRALAGGVATDIYLSRWFIIVTVVLRRVPGHGQALRRAARGRRAGPRCARRCGATLGRLRLVWRWPQRPRPRLRRVGASRDRRTSRGTSSRSSPSCCGSRAT